MKRPPLIGRRLAKECGLIVCLGLAGCATTQGTETVVDTYCLTAKKIRWSVEDTAETIRQAEIHNKTIDRRCGVPGKA
jgi:hypothetical protein